MYKVEMSDTLAFRQTVARNYAYAQFRHFQFTAQMYSIVFAICSPGVLCIAIFVLLDL